MTWPLSVSRANVDKALRLLGFDPAEVGALWIDRSQVMVQPPGHLVLDGGWRGCIQILNDDQYRQMTEWEARKAAAAKAAEEIERRRIERARQAQ